MNDECDDEGPDSEPPESGPFCRHFGDPADCDRLCERCGHRCSAHDQGGEDDSECNMPFGESPDDVPCPCEAWVEPEDA